MVKRILDRNLTLASKVASANSKYSIQTAIASMTVERMDLEMESDKVKDCRLEITSRTLHAQQTMDAMSQ